jgi:hypothetical protein
MLIAARSSQDFACCWRVRERALEIRFRFRSTTAPRFLIARNRRDRTPGLWRARWRTAVALSWYSKAADQVNLSAADRF